jgi:hypothetical protein
MSYKKIKLEITYIDSEDVIRDKKFKENLKERIFQDICVETINEVE